MAVRLSKASPASKHTRIDFGDDGDLNLEWNGGRLTGARQDEINAAMQTGEARALYGALVDIVASWDLLGDDGEPLALDADQLYQSMPLELVVTILTTLATDGAGEANGGT
jgi:hypothetical protein